ncbi:MAG: hypothetical protein ACQERB_06555 [Promethearchaeati archaeon]
MIAISTKRLKIGKKRLALVLIILSAIATFITIFLVITLNQPNSGEPSG